MSCSKLAKKRKIESECRVFNTQWTEKYFFTDVGSKATCLICNNTVAVFKEYNLKRHFQTKHTDFGKGLSSQELQKKAAELLKSLKQQQNVFVKTSSVQRNATKASLVIAHKIARKNKPFSEAEFIKECMVEAVSVVSPESRSKIEAIPLSRRSVVRRIDAIAVNIHEQLLAVSRNFEWFSIALDESTDCQDTAQLLIYIRGIDDNFVITEELLSIESLKDTTTGKDLYDSVMNSMMKSGLCLGKLASITTDGAPSLRGKHCGFVKLMNNTIKEKFPLNDVLSFHCIIHQESLCKSSLNIKHIMDPVVHAVNLIRARGLNHRQFRSFLEDIEADFSDVLYHTNVRWLSMGKVLERAWALKEEILLFFDMKGISCDFSKEMQSEEWVCDFAFAVDIMQKLNELNTKCDVRRGTNHFNTA